MPYGEQAISSSPPPPNKKPLSVTQTSLLIVWLSHGAVVLEEDLNGSDPTCTVMNGACTTEPRGREDVGAPQITLQRNDHNRSQTGRKATVNTGGSTRKVA